MATKRRIKIPVVSIITLMLTLFFFVEPNLIKNNEKEITMFANEAKAYTLNNIAFLIKISIPLENTSFKTGYIKNIEVHPTTINFEKYKIQQIDIEKEKIDFLQSRNVEIRFVILLEYNSMEIIEGYTTSNKYRITFTDNNDNAILDSKGNISSYTFQLKMDNDSLRFQNGRNSGSFRVPNLKKVKTGF